jgi:glutamyl/glutaminyl-tRNA synthetase
LEAESNFVHIPQVYLYMLRTRIAPTPSGYLHLGNAFSFLLTALIARKASGSILLRIDDIDSERTKPEYVSDIFESLEWLGIEWQEGPTGPDDFEQNWSQHKRLDIYAALLAQLREQHQLFACECSRKKMESISGNAYPGFCETAGIPLDSLDTSWRIKVPNDRVVSFHDERIGQVHFPLGSETGSFIVRKKDKLPSYQLVSLADDTHFRVNFIVRGEDLLPSTAMQLFLAEQLKLEGFTNSQFLHHQLQRDESGQKLSKSAGSVSLQYMRKRGIDVSEIYTLFAEQFLSISSDRITTFHQLEKIFQSVWAISRPSS